jgi:hypothetical protein
MSRRPAHITQADIARVIRAAKREGAAEVEVRLGDARVLIRLSPSSTATTDDDDKNREIVL